MDVIYSWACILILIGFHRLAEMKLTEIPTSLRNIFSESLDPSVGGLPSWEQFGERLLGLNALELQKFKSQSIPSPTAAIMHQKMGEDPTTTLADAVNILDEIGRKDVVELIVKAVRNGGDQNTTQPHHHNLSHQSSSLDSGYGNTRAVTEPTLQRSSSLPPPVPVTVTITPPMRDVTSNSEAATSGKYIHKIVLICVQIADTRVYVAPKQHILIFTWC